uniref:Zinc finger protein 549 n=2 Tax=Pan TaxID=9596 RepID=A0A2I3TMW4_PANTR
MAEAALVNTPQLD